MSKPRFTPGPWEVVERSDCGGFPYWVVQTVRERNGWEITEVRCDTPAPEANARLIASAPTLLEALTLAASKPLAEHCTDEEWAFIRSAILGAQGAQP